MKIDEYLKELEYLEEKRHNKSVRRYWGKRGFVRDRLPKSLFAHPIYSAISEIILCKEKNIVCTRRWSEMDICFKNADRRYCKVCDKWVFRISNIPLLKKYMNQADCIAIPTDSPYFKEIQDKITSEIYLYKCIQKLRVYMQREIGYIESEDISVCHSSALYAIISEIGESTRNRRYGVRYHDIGSIETCFLENSLDREKMMQMLKNTF